MHTASRRLPRLLLAPLHVRSVTYKSSIAAALSQAQSPGLRGSQSALTSTDSKPPARSAAPHVDPELIRALSEHLVARRIPTHLAKYFPPEAALKIILGHARLSDEEILSLAAFGPEPPENTLLYLVDELIVKLMLLPNPESKALTARLCRISLSKGNMSGGRILIAPYKFGGREVLLLPDEEAKEVLDEFAVSRPLVAMLYWLKRSTFRYLHAKNLPASEQIAFQEGFRKTLEGLYEGSAGGEEDQRGYAARMLGNAYAQGRVLPRDGEKARVWWERAVACIDVDPTAAARAAFSLGSVYLAVRPKSGQEPLFPPDKEKGMHYYGMAKHLYSTVPYYFGEAYYLDRFDNPHSSIRRHFEKYGVEPDDALAAMNFYLAARKNHQLAKRMFAEMLVLGRADPPVPEDDVFGTPSAEGESSESALEDEQGETDDELASPPAESDPVFAPRSRLETLQYALNLLDDPGPKPTKGPKEKKWTERLRTLRGMILQEMEKLMRDVEKSMQEMENSKKQESVEDWVRFINQSRQGLS